MLEFMKLYSDMEQIFEPFSDEERGRLLTAMMAYCFRGEEPEFDGPERYIWPVLRRHFDQCTERAEILRANAAKGGRPRNSEEPNETKENQTKPNETKENQEKPNETKNNLEQEQEHIQEQEHTKEQEQKERRARGVDAKFEIFWKSYPRKVGKGAAQKCFERLKPDDMLFARMLKAVDTARGSPQWTKDGGQYIPNPATWLNQKRWEDEPAAAIPKETGYQKREYEKRDYEGMYTDLGPELEAIMAARQ